MTYSSIFVNIRHYIAIIYKKGFYGEVEKDKRKNKDVICLA